MPNYWQDKRVVITGGGGFVGLHLLDALFDLDCELHIIRSRAYDLRREESVADMFKDVGKVDVLFHLAANVGGIGANQKHPAQMYADNVRMDTLLIDYAAHNKVGCFVGMGSVCAYPKYAPIPFIEEDLWNGYPEETNAAYGIAKRGMLACLQAHGQEFGLDWRYALSTNLYGPGDNYDLNSGHVVAGLIRKFSEAAATNAPSVTLWGTGKATRDFLYVGDVASGLIHLAEHGECNPVNLGSGREVSIKELAHILAITCGYGGRIEWDATRPDGQPRRVLDISRMSEMDWVAETVLEDGLIHAVQAYKRESVYA
jgi:GDP-L-fucose synthase